MIFGEGYQVPCNLGELSGFTNISDIVLNALTGRKYERRFVPAAGSSVQSDDNIMSYVDLTNLKTVATADDIKALIDKAIAAGCASVCIPPCFVKDASAYADGRMAICTVIGFPNGYSTTGSKIYEAKEACDNGASEIDMVININFVKSGRMEEVSREIKLIADAVHEKGAILKVIIETCCLEEDEKISLCRIVTDAGADFIKTSTGFGTAGAAVEDVALMRANVGSGVKVKAAGGIRSEEAAREMIKAGASRIGASRL